MSEETLRRFLERLNGDASFRERVQKEATSVFAEFELSPAEQVALTSNDEDALRRLAGADVSGNEMVAPRVFCILSDSLMSGCAGWTVSPMCR